MKTKKTVHSLFIIVSFCMIQKIYSQKSNLDLAENNLMKLYTKVLQVSDSSYQYSQNFEKEFVTLLKKNPSTLQYDFKNLFDGKNCYVKTSSNGKFRIYSFNQNYGGTMHFFKTVYQYRTRFGVKVKVSNLNPKDPGSYCSKIYETKIGNTTYYMPIENRIYSNNDNSQSISVFNIEKDKLIHKAKLFFNNNKIKNKRSNKIEIVFDFSSVVDRPERPLELITFDEVKNSIYIPLIEDKFNVSKRFEIYKLTGNLFKYNGITKL
jgi:hypothetical protein